MSSKKSTLSKPKRILIGISSLNIGGAEKQAIEDANMLGRTHQVVLLSFADGPMKSLLSENVRLIILPEKSYIRRVKAILRILREHHTDVMHAHLYAPMVLMSWAGWLSGTPVFWNFHSHAYENSRKAKELHKLSAKLPSVRKILFPATELIRYYEEEGYGFGRKKVMVAYNSGQDHSSPTGELPDKQEGVLSIVYVGRLVGLKQVEFLIEMAAALRNRTEAGFQINIVGDGPEAGNLKTLAEELGVTDIVNFRGFRSDTLSWYRHADLFILPSREEVLSLSLIDAGLAGKPAIAMNTGGNEDIVLNGKTGYLVSSREELFEKALQLINNEILRSEMGRAAAAECTLRFSIEARLGILEKLYDEAV